MATSEPLVPTGGPYASRGPVKQAMAQAGLPVAPPAPVSGGSQGGFTSSTPASFSPPSGTGGDPLDVLLAAGPGAFPFIQEQAPEAQPPAAPRSVARALVESSQSEFGRAVATRLSQLGR